jgi:hypothetical protein
MFQMTCISPRRLSGFSLLVLAGVLFAGNSFSAVKYDLRASTGDKVNSYTGKARQGSFGAPAINSKGSIAYPCILSGNTVSAFTNTAIIFRKKGKKKAQVAVQSGVTLDGSFLPFYTQANTFGYPGSQIIYSIGRTIGINEKNRVGFVAEVLNEVETFNYSNGAFTGTGFHEDDRTDYGVVFPISGGFQNVCVSKYDGYEADVLDRTLSISSNGAVPRNSVFQITPTRSVPGFAYSLPTVLDSTIGYLGSPTATVTYPYYLSESAIVATTESRVIGLPYDTTYANFSDAIIADHNRIFVVANLTETGKAFDGIWQGTNPNLQPVVVLDRDAPDGGTFQSFDGKVGPNRKGSAAAFIANVTGGTVNRAVYRADRDGGNLKTIVAQGANAPGTSDNFQSLELAAVNNKGSVAILATTSGTNSTGDNLEGVWVTDPAGNNLKLIVIVGQSLQVGKVQKRVTHIEFNPVSGISSKGQLAFTASFSDRTSGVFIATP